MPAPWKHANVTMISKPNKPIGLSNLRPILLTSCVEKLMELMVLDRLTLHMEHNNKISIPDFMYGFRPYLSTQGILLQIKEEVIDNLSTSQKSAILALDGKGAFDNVSHGAILKNLQDSQCELQMIHPSLYSYDCQLCVAPNTLYYMVWECKGMKELPEVLAPPTEQWEALLSSEVLDDQRGLMIRARHAA
ncbi:uncharacterized protein LOC144160517 [Haemaphysalis longicornis]